VGGPGTNWSDINYSNSLTAVGDCAGSPSMPLSARPSIMRCRRVDCEVLMIHDSSPSTRIDKIQTDYQRLDNHRQNMRFQILRAPAQKREVERIPH
jgi:hypothetical protein